MQPSVKNPGGCKTTVCMLMRCDMERKGIMAISNPVIVTGLAIQHIPQNQTSVRFAVSNIAIGPQHAALNDRCFYICRIKSLKWLKSDRFMGGTQ
jgi:hypothetical protein